MMTAGIMIDSWKLAIFKRHLDAAKYEYTEHPGMADDTRLLKVKTADVAALAEVIQAAQRECKTNDNSIN